MNDYIMAARIRDDLRAAGVDLAKFKFYPCIPERGVFRILGRPFDSLSELRQVLASHNGPPGYILEPLNFTNPLKIVDDPSVFLHPSERAAHPPFPGSGVKAKKARG